MEIFYVALLTLAASLVGTISGFGTSTIMIPVLVLFLPPVETIFLVSIIHWFGNVWKMALFRSGLRIKLFFLFGVTGLATSYLGASLTLSTKQDILLRILGVFLAGYSVYLLFETRFKVPASSATALLGGSLSGFFAGMFGIGGAIRSAFLTMFDLPKAIYIATAGAIGLVVDSTRIVTFIAGGAELSKLLAYGLIIFIPVSFVGANTAKRIVDKIPQEKFRPVVAAFLFVLGAKLIVWP